MNNNKNQSIGENEGGNTNNTNNDNKIINSIPFRIKTMYKNFKINNNKKKYCKEYNDF